MHVKKSITNTFDVKCIVLPSNYHQLFYSVGMKTNMEKLGEKHYRHKKNFIHSNKEDVGNRL